MRRAALVLILLASVTAHASGKDHKQAVLALEDGLNACWEMAAHKGTPPPNEDIARAFGLWREKKASALSLDPDVLTSKDKWLPDGMAATQAAPLGAWARKCDAWFARTGLEPMAAATPPPTPTPSAWVTFTGTPPPAAEDWMSSPTPTPAP